MNEIDNLINIGQIEKSYIVKIYVEGAEMDVLEEMIDIVNKYNPELFIEIHDANLEQKQTNVKYLLNYLAKNNYSIYHV